MGGVMQLPEERNFSGFGNGKFASTGIVQLWFNLLDIWCSQIAYVVDQSVTGTEDILCGHDFMQLYDIKLDLKKGKSF